MAKLKNVVGTRRRSLTPRLVGNDKLLRQKEWNDEFEYFDCGFHEGLNVVENWNSANGFVFFGKAARSLSTGLMSRKFLPGLSGGFGCLDRIFIFISEALRFIAYAAFGSTGRLSK